MATADAFKVQTELKRIVTAINELSKRIATLEARVSAVEKSEDHPKSK